MIARLEPSPEVRGNGRFSLPVHSWTNRDVLDFIDFQRTRTGDEYLGLATAPCAPGVADLAMELGARCATLRDAIDCVTRFMNLATRAFHFSLCEGSDLATLAIARQPAEAASVPPVSDWLMVAWHKLAQWLIGVEIWLERTEFDHPLESEYRHYSSMFGGECLFNSDACRLVFQRDLLDRRVVRTPCEAVILKATTPGHFEQPALLAQTWKQRVRNLVCAQLTSDGSVPTLQQLAEELKISERSLQRLLKAEHSSYRQIKAEARLEVARDILARADARMSEASCAAGFAEANALTRALRNRQGRDGQSLRREVRSWRIADGGKVGD